MRQKDNVTTRSVSFPLMAVAFSIVIFLGVPGISSAYTCTTNSDCDAHGPFGECIDSTCIWFGGVCADMPDHTNCEPTDFSTEPVGYAECRIDSDCSPDSSPPPTVLPPAPPPITPTPPTPPPGGPSCTLTASPDTGTAPLKTNLLLQEQGTGFNKRKIMFGDGADSGLLDTLNPTVGHTYQDPNTYTATGQLIDRSCFLVWCTDDVITQCTDTVTVLDPFGPTPTPTPTPTSTPPPSTPTPTGKPTPTPAPPPPPGGPTATTVTVTQPDYCSVVSPTATVSWTYSDPQGDPQTAYQVQVVSAASTTPLLDCICSGSTWSTPSSCPYTGSCTGSTTSFEIPEGILDYATTYTARVKVSDTTITLATVTTIKPHRFSLLLAFLLQIIP